MTTRKTARKPSFGSDSVFVESPTIVSTDQVETHVRTPTINGNVGTSDEKNEFAAKAEAKAEAKVGEGRKAKDLNYLIISGGTGANSIASAFGNSPAFVLPVSDDGGSSSEILRCFGGPSIGDIRSRLIRLIPLVTDPSTKDELERLAIYNLLAYRFPSTSPEKEVRELWHEIVEGRSELWDGIGEDKKECIRAFLVHFQTLCLKRAHKRFSFRNFSLGNGFLTGARDLFGSLPSAIFLFKSIAGVNHGVQVIPVINTNQTVTIAAQLLDSTVLVGQCNISHPTSPVTLHPSLPTPNSNSPSGHNTPTPTPLSSHTNAQPKTSVPANIRNHFRRDSRTFDTPDTAFTSPRTLHVEAFGQINEGEEGWSNSAEPGARADESGSNIGYRKGEEEKPLESRIERVFYINLYGQEIYPEPNSDFLDSLHQRDILVYSCGSLWTSIVPCLALRGLASHIAGSQNLKAKVLLLNSSNDRETPDYTASEYLTTIFAMLKHYNRPGKRSDPGTMYNDLGRNGTEERLKMSTIISHVICLEGSKMVIDEYVIKASGIKVIHVPLDIHQPEDGSESASASAPLFTPESVEWAMERVLQDL
ncbi:uncharacterized protein I303_105126 [Kwoniella dejecticola CBS 10117]|uniref:Uncharacterized protein n=1 Tax=Kwoniella dejecticola CBS 10117 TaxID=1296121 RepID=A0A1A6A3D8_9TREE|nr:uncharacterized protein I303_05429 [Kwoniella dejecticola CBS 10117]OBR84570.1 hypothetical protein I303_05429 [Kwoniella dejecticola CBS 10117]